MMTAYVILQDHPLQPGETGPSLTTTAADASRYQEMLQQDQSVLPVTAGMKFSQLQMMEGMLVPSANNFAEILAKWDAGSEAGFVAKMNATAQSLGMSHTTYVDTSGFESGSVSTPSDQLILAVKLMQNPVFAQIVAMDHVTLPGIGQVPSTNALLGTDGVVGIKTGYTEEAGGNLAFAARKQALGQEIEIIGAVFGQADHQAAFDATTKLIDAVAANLASAAVIHTGDMVATFDLPWSDPVDVVAGQDVTMLYWPGMTLQTSVEFDQVKAPLKAGSQVGWLTLTVGEQQQRIPMVLKDDLPNAGFFWRLTRF
jgi:D-alanyl-D-alanine carboxypeptidase (penicillin-binding protein 5/6)